MERVVSEFIKIYAQDKTIEVHLVLYGISREIFFPIPATVYVYKPKFKFNNKFRLYYTIKTMLYLRKQVKLIQPDAIISFGEYWNNFVLLSLYGLTYPVFVSDRCQPDKSLGKLHDFLRKILYPKAKGVIAQTDRAKQIFQNLYHHKNIEVIGNPIRSIIPKPGIKKENIVLTVGRLIKTKHHDELIKLFVQINKPGWKLVIVGDDALKQKNKVKLEQLIKELKAEDKVILAGKRRDVDDFYRKSKIFAFTSSSEGFPNVIGEAMSAGLPVVAFDCVAGPSELIKNGENGFLVDLFDYDTFKKKLEFLMNEESIREKMSSKARLSIQKFSPEVISMKLKEFIL
ncbi:glycosyltransferase [Calditrichota bacterium GD2]